jgi:hypothetical protein
MMDSDQHELNELSSHEGELFAALPRESTPAPGSADRVVAQLRRDGMLPARPRISMRTRVILQAAAGLALMVAGAIGGHAYGTRNSLEQALSRSDLTVVDRVRLLQRAGSAYVTAANGYADATKQADSTAVEVANTVLRGAAHAVVRSNLNTRTAGNLLVALGGRDTTTHKSLLWY